MKNKYLFLFVFLVFQYQAFCQSTGMKWEFGDIGSYDEIRDFVVADGRVFLLGNSDNPGAINGDAWLATYKYGIDNYPFPLYWQKFIGTDSLEDAISLCLTPDERFIYIGGMTNFNAEPGDNDIFISKLDTSGSIIWSKTYGGNDFDDFYKILPSPDGGAICIGASLSFTGLQRAAYVFKVDMLGDTVWTKLVKGNFAQYFFDGVPYPGGGYVLSGSSFKSGSSFETLVTRIREDGTIVWSKTFGGAGSDLGYKVAVSATAGDTNIYLSGVTTTNTINGGGDVLVLNISQAGTLIWAKTYGDAQYNRGQGIAIHPNHPDELLVYGYSNAEGDPQKTTFYMFLNKQTGDIISNTKIESSNTTISEAPYQVKPFFNSEDWMATGYEYFNPDPNGQGTLISFNQNFFGGRLICRTNLYSFQTNSQNFQTADLLETSTGGSATVLTFESRGASLHWQPDCFEVNNKTNMQPWLFEVFPNPVHVNESINIKLLNGLVGTLHIYNNQGQIIKAALLNGENSQFEFFPGTAGMYLITLHSAEGKLNSRKIWVK